MGFDTLLYWSGVHWDSELSGPPVADPWSDPSTVLVTEPDVTSAVSDAVSVVRRLDAVARR